MSNRQPLTSAIPPPKEQPYAEFLGGADVVNSNWFQVLD